MFLHRSLKTEKLHTTITSTIQLLSQLAFNGLVNQDHRKLPRLVFDESDFKKVLFRTLEGNFRILENIHLIHEKILQNYTKNIFISSYNCKKNRSIETDHSWYELSYHFILFSQGQLRRRPFCRTLTSINWIDAIMCP